MLQRLRDVTDIDEMMQISCCVGHKSSQLQSSRGMFKEANYPLAVAYSERLFINQCYWPV